MLYYGDTAGNNVKASQYVTELGSKDDLHQFVNSQPESVLTVVNVSLLRCAGARVWCAVHVVAGDGWLRLCSSLPPFCWGSINHLSQCPPAYPACSFLPHLT